MKRRDWLAVVSALGAARALFGGGIARPKIGICAFSCHQHWSAVGKGVSGLRFEDTAGFLRYARDLGFEGAQCGFRPAEKDLIREIRQLVDGEGSVRGSRRRGTEQP